MLLLLFALQSDLIRQERINYCTQAKIQNNLSVRQKTLLTCRPLENSDIAVNQLFCFVSNHAVTLCHVYEKKGLFIHTKWKESNILWSHLFLRFTIVQKQKFNDIWRCWCLQLCNSQLFQVEKMNHQLICHQTGAYHMQVIVVSANRHNNCDCVGIAFTFGGLTVQEKMKANKEGVPSLLDSNFTKDGDYFLWFVYPRGHHNPWYTLGLNEWMI